MRKKIVERLEAIVHSTAQAHNCTVQLEVIPLTPAVVNQHAEMGRIKEVAAKLFPESPIEANYRSMGSEDMAFFMERVPGCFLMIGSSNPEKGLDAAHHHPAFDFDEQALSNGAALLTAATLDYLNTPWD